MRYILSVCALALPLSFNAQAGLITNGGFESGNLTGWSVSGGTVSVLNSYTADDAGSPLTVNPTEGNWFARITAGNPITTLMSSIFSVSAGSVVSFDWFFDSNDYLPFNDMAVSLLKIDGSTIYNTTLANVSNTGNYAFNGWNTASFVAPTGGNAVLSFQSINGIDTLQDSYFGIDNVQATSVPIPGALALLAIGAVGLRRFMKPAPADENDLGITA